MVLHISVPERVSRDSHIDEQENEDHDPKPPVIHPITPYPTKQMHILACCRFSEPVAMTSSFPYLFFMIRDFKLTDNEKEIGRYVGLLASSFSFAQFFSGILPAFTYY